MTEKPQQLHTEVPLREMVDRASTELGGYAVNDEPDATEKGGIKGSVLTTTDLLKRAKTQLGNTPSTQYPHGKRLG